MWIPEEDNELALGFHRSKSPLDLSKYNLTPVSDVNTENVKIDSENVESSYNSSDANAIRHNDNENNKDIDFQKPKIVLQLNQMKVWMLLNRDAMIILGFLTICLIIGIGIPLSLVYRNQKVVSRPIVYQRNASIPGTKSKNNSFIL